MLRKWSRLRLEKEVGWLQIFETTCKEGSNLYGVDVEGKKKKKGCRVCTSIHATHISEKYISGQKKKVFN